MSARFGQLNPYDLHKRLINEYVLKGRGDTALLRGRDASKDKNDADILREHHRFLWDDDESAATWEQQLARKYYDKLFKEYCICDLSRYKENKIALRWRTGREVIDGRGQFICGSTSCTSREALRSWEVNFVYVEQSERKNALVKVRLCVDCSAKLNYRSQKREVKRHKKMARQLNKRLSASDKKHSSRSSTRHYSQEATTSTASTTAETGDEQKDIKFANDDGNDLTTVRLNDSDTRKRQQAPNGANAEAECWQKTSTVEEKSREEEFDEYLEDLLL